MAAFLAPDEGTRISGLWDDHYLRSAGREALPIDEPVLVSTSCALRRARPIPTIEGPALCHAPSNRDAARRGHQHRPLRGCLLSLRATTGGGSIAGLRIEHIPALLAGSLRNGLDRMIIGTAREAVPMTCQWPAGAL